MTYDDGARIIGPKFLLMSRCEGAADKGQLYKEEGKEGAEIARRVFQGHLVVLLVSMCHKVKSSVKLLLVTMQSKMHLSPSLEKYKYLPFLSKQMREILAK